MLNRSSSGHIVAALLGIGLVRETAAAQAEPGRAGRRDPLELVPDAVFFLGIESASSASGRW